MSSLGNAHAFKQRTRLAKRQGELPGNIVLGSKLDKDLIGQVAVDLRRAEMADRLLGSIEVR